MSKTRELQTYWWDYLGTAERLLRSLYEQTAALTLRDIARIERLQPELDGLLCRMKEIDDLAVARARKLAEDLGAEPSLRGLIRALDTAEAQQVQALANRVLVVARNVQHVLDKNRQLAENELSFVDGSISLLAKAAADQQGKYGPVPQAAVLMDQVA